MLPPEDQLHVSVLALLYHMHHLLAQKSLFPAQATRGHHLDQLGKSLGSQGGLFGEHFGLRANALKQFPFCAQIQMMSYSLQIEMELQSLLFLV